MKKSQKKNFPRKKNRIFKKKNGGENINKTKNLEFLMDLLSEKKPVLANKETKIMNENCKNLACNGSRFNLKFLEFKKFENYHLYIGMLSLQGQKTPQLYTKVSHYLSKRRNVQA